MTNLNSRLRQLRQLHNVTQVQVSKSCNIAERTYQSLEANQKPNFDNLIALADFFDVSLDYLVGRSDDPHRH